jgi:hypothetical protein
MLGYRPHSRKELVDKLLERGHNESSAAAALGRLQELVMVDRLIRAPDTCTMPEKTWKQLPVDRHAVACLAAARLCIRSG